MYEFGYRDARPVARRGGHPREVTYGNVGIDVGVENVGGGVGVGKVGPPAGVVGATDGLARDGDGDGGGVYGGGT